jgi:uncharacterized protein (DUF1697 family)
MTVFVALLRAIGPASHARMSMPDLRDACRAAGLGRVATYIQTGNLLIDTAEGADGVQAIVEGVLRRFDLANRVFLRKTEDLAQIVAAHPFPDAAAVRPSELVVCFLATPPGAAGLAALRDYQGPERFKPVGADLCIDYPAGVAGSKLLPSAIERRLDRAATARNWNTVRKLLVLAQAM